MEHAPTITLERLQKSGAYRQIQYSEKLTKEEKEEALENLVSILDQDINIYVKASTLGGIFVWMDSEQGFGYWNNLYEKIHGKVQR